MSADANQYSDHTQKNELLAAVMKLQAEKRQLVEALQALVACVDNGSLIVDHSDRRATAEDITRAVCALEKAGAQ